MLSTKIKEATKVPHQEVEKKVVSRIKSIRSDADHADLLKHFYAYFNVVEKAIAPYITSAILPDLAGRRNASYIKADIEALGASTDELPLAVAPEINNIVQAIGALYVLEGSIMGGPYIVQMLQKSGLTKGFSFFQRLRRSLRTKMEYICAGIKYHRTKRRRSRTSPEKRPRNLCQIRRCVQ